MINLICWSSLPASPFHSLKPGPQFTLNFTYLFCWWGAVFWNSKYLRKKWQRVICLKVMYHYTAGKARCLWKGETSCFSFWCSYYLDSILYDVRKSHFTLIRAILVALPTCHQLRHISKLAFPEDLALFSSLTRWSFCPRLKSCNRVSYVIWHLSSLKSRYLKSHVSVYANTDTRKQVLRYIYFYVIISL